MFEMDAFVGVDVLGLSFMKGDQPHAGFPEAAYHTMAEQLARARYRVVVVEQVCVCAECGRLRGEAWPSLSTHPCTNPPVQPPNLKPDRDP
jgi:hypothetical protein